MSSTLTTPSAIAHPPAARLRDHRRRGRAARTRPPLARYTDFEGRAREIVTRAGVRGSVLVVDRDALTLADRRLLAHLAPDEPPANAALVSALYLDQLRRHPVRARRLTAEDLRAAPWREAEEPDAQALAQALAGSTVDPSGDEYRLLPRDGGMTIPELRWCRCPSPHGGSACARTVSVRQAVASLESYEPVRTLTRGALAAIPAREATISTAVLRGELARLEISPIVLNRKLREVTLAMIEREGLTLSEIALRCGRVKRDAAGNESGETSWLARRLGLMPEGGKDAPTPWVHSDVLALIARRGLGVSPREVEAA